MSDQQRCNEFVGALDQNRPVMVAAYQLVHEAIRAVLVEKMPELDPNWVKFSIDFEGGSYGPRDAVLGHSPSDPEGCRVELNYRPGRVVLEGPKAGQVVLTDRLFELIPEPLVVLVRMLDVFVPWVHQFVNPDHRIELVPGRTILDFENTDSGVVENVDGDEFDVRFFHSSPSRDGTVERYTMDRLQEELLDSDESVGQACGVEYFPRVGKDGTVCHTAEEYVAAFARGLFYF